MLLEFPAGLRWIGQIETFGHNNALYMAFDEGCTALPNDFPIHLQKLVIRIRPIQNHSFISSPILLFSLPFSLLRSSPSLPSLLDPPSHHPLLCQFPPLSRDSTFNFLCNSIQSESSNIKKKNKNEHENKAGFPA